MSHSFNVDVILSHPYAKKKQILHLQFAADEFDPVVNTNNLLQSEMPRSVKYEAQEEDERPPSSGGIFGWLFGGPAQDQEKRDEPVKAQRPPKQHKFLSYFIFMVFLVGAILFILSFVCQVNLAVSQSLRAFNSYDNLAL